MAMLRDIYFYPPMGVVDQPWGEYPPPLDRLVRTARRVCERYAEGLRAAGITSVGPGLLTIHPDQETQAVSEGRGSEPAVTVLTGRPDGCELARCRVPAGVEDLAAQSRARLVLALIDAAMAELGRARGWDAAKLRQAHDHVISHDLGFTWTSPWKSSRTRAHRVQVRVNLDDDGYGRLLVVFAQRDGTMVGAVGPFVAFSTVEGFKRSWATVRWNEDDTGVRLTPYSGLFGLTGPAVTVLVEEARRLDPVPLLPDGPPSTWHVRILDFSRAGLSGGELPTEIDGSAHHIRFLGGGPTDLASADYLKALHHLLVQATDPPWQRWWSVSPHSLLEIGYRLREAAPVPSVHAGRRCVTARINRPAHTQLQGRDGLEQARNDVVVLFERIRTRFNLAELPPLADLDTLQALTWADEPDT